MILSHGWLLFQKKLFRHNECFWSFLSKQINSLLLIINHREAKGTKSLYLKKHFRLFWALEKTYCRKITLLIVVQMKQPYNFNFANIMCSLNVKLSES